MKQAMIFAAGLGTRLKPLTDHKPKALVEVGGETLLERVISGLKEAGTERIIINVHHFADMIEQFVKEHGNFGVDIRISDERNELLETGGGLKHAAPLFDADDTILIHNVDILSNVDLSKLYEKGDEHDALLVVSERKTKRYLLFDDDMRLKGWTNIETGEVKSVFGQINPKDYKMYAFSGIHTFSPRLLDKMKNYPDKFGIIDFYLKACAEADICGYVKDDLQLMDVGKAETIDMAKDFLDRLTK